MMGRFYVKYWCVYRLFTQFSRNHKPVTTTVTEKITGIIINHLHNLDGLVVNCYLSLYVSLITWCLASWAQRAWDSQMTNPPVALATEKRLADYWGVITGYGAFTPTWENVRSARVDAARGIRSGLVCRNWVVLFTPPRVPAEIVHEAIVLRDLQ